MSAKRLQRCADPKCMAAVPEGQTDPCVVPIAVPYVFRYLVAELLAMNVKLQLTAIKLNIFDIYFLTGALKIAKAYKNLSRKKRN